MSASRRVSKLVAVTLAITALPLAGPAASRAEDPAWGPGVYMTQAIGRIMDTILPVTEDKSNPYGWDSGICIMAGFMMPKSTLQFNSHVTAGQSYLFVGAGDDDVEDVDLEILDARGQILVKDTKANNYPVVRFDPTTTGMITIRLKLYKAPRGSFCVAAVLRSGGWNVPRESLIQAAAGVLSRGQTINKNVAEQVTFRSGQGQWAMYGGMFRPNEEYDVTNVGLGTGKRVVFSAGDRTTSDIDLYVTFKGKTVSDTDPDPNPTLSLTVSNADTATIKVKNAGSNSRGGSMILTAILDLD